MISSLCYDDAHGAIEWLGKAFGFEPKLVVPGQDNKVMHSQLHTPDGRSMIMLYSARDDEFGRPQRSPQNLDGRSNQSLYVIIEDVEEHFERAKKAGAEILLEPTPQDYGGVIYTCRDPEGHMWSFGSFDPWAEQ